MKQLKYLFSLLISLLYTRAFHANAREIVCYYDAASFDREGIAELSLEDLAIALPTCDYLIYGYVSINPKTFELQTLNLDLDIKRDHFRKIIKLKEQKNPDMFVLLSVGGERKFDTHSAHNKYLELLEFPAYRAAFVNCTKQVLKKFGFDGLDLAWQFPENPPRLNGGWKKLWSTIKSWFKTPAPLDELAYVHKQQFTALIGELKEAFEVEKFILSLTMLPNVNSALFIDIRAVIDNLSFVNLAAFDFQTPERYPEVADHPAPLYATEEQYYEDNVNYQVTYWLKNGAPSNKINLGIATYGRSWRSSYRQKYFNLPMSDMEGAASGGVHTKLPGFLGQSEICEKIDMHSGCKSVGSFYYDMENIWVGYEDIHTIGAKIEYVHKHKLRGVALFDLSMDDIKGKCNGERFSVLKTIKKTLLSYLHVEYIK